MLTGSTARRTNLVDHTFWDARLNRHSLKRLLAGRQHRNLEMQVRAAGLARILHKDDLPDKLSLGDSIAIATETMGLNINRDRLCLVQISNGNNVCHSLISNLVGFRL